MLLTMPYFTDNNRTSFLDDVTSALSATTHSGDDDDEAQYARMRYIVNDILLPVVFGIGVAGNALNAVLLSCRRGAAAGSGSGSGGAGRPTAFERSAAAGLVALSASDLAFCVVGFARVLFLGTPPRGSWRAVAGLYYSTFDGALMNLFLFSSTWLIALVSVERCLAVCYPFRATSIIRVRRTIAAHVVVFVVAVLVNVPLFLRFEIVSVTFCPGDMLRRFNATVLLTTVGAASTTAAATISAAEGGRTCSYTLYYTQPSSLAISRPGLLYVHKVFWFAFGTFLPLILIVGSNVRLIHEICAMRSSSAAATLSSTSSRSLQSGSASSSALDRDRTATRTLTLTLIAIGVLFLLLVCPSISIQFWRFASYESYGESGGAAAAMRYSSSSSTSGRVEEVAILITNLTQAIKFSSNFLLYCFASRSFRRTFGKMFTARRCSRGANRDAADATWLSEGVGNALLIAPANGGKPAAVQQNAATGV